MSRSILNQVPPDILWMHEKIVLWKSTRWRQRAIKFVSGCHLLFRRCVDDRCVSHVERSLLDLLEVVHDVNGGPMSLLISEIP